MGASRCRMIYMEKNLNFYRMNTEKISVLNYKETDYERD